MSLDITAALANWNFDPDSITVRVVDGNDGREKIQMRLDLGVLQMELDGRPDGSAIQGHPSWLDFHLEQQQAHNAQHPDGPDYVLETEDCAELLREGVQYYHRYVSFWSLRRYELCARDTERNLKLFSFVREHARHERDKLQFDQWRPYVIMMHTRAVATPLVELRQNEAAISAIENGVRRIENFLADYDREDQHEEIGELLFLKGWLQQIKSESAAPEQKPIVEPILNLRKRLAEAVSGEDYEKAARLRDELRRLEGLAPPTHD